MAAPVRIVRPDKSFGEVVEDLVYSVVLLAIQAWIVMLLVPLAGFTPGYWKTLGLLYVAHIVFDGDAHRLWTSRK